MICNIDARRLACRRCGSAVTRADVKRNCNPGLGDRIGVWLSWFGVTEQRVSRFIGAPCGCGSRVQALNDLGRRIGIG